MTAAIQHVIVRGRVQGVGFRAFIEQAALREGVEGWVRNRRDGTVEAVFAGKADTVAVLVESCRRGPAAAAVSGVEVSSANMALLDLRPPGERFSMLRTE